MNAGRAVFDLDGRGLPIAPARFAAVAGPLT